MQYWYLEYGHCYTITQPARKNLVSFSDTLCRIQVRRGGAFASHEFGLLPGCLAGWCLRLTFASSSARGLGRASQLWRSFWDYMVCVLDSSSPCAWSGFMRDASRLDSGFFLPFYFPSLTFESLAQYNCRSWHRAVAYFTFEFFIYFILFPFQLGNLSLVYSEFVFLSRSLVGGYWAQLAYTCCVGPRYLVRWDAIIRSEPCSSVAYRTQSSGLF